MTYQHYVVFLLIAGVCIPFSSCHPDQHASQEYNHKYHRVSGTTEALSTSASSATEVLLTSGVRMSNQSKFFFIIRIGTIVAVIIGIICILGCIIFCCPCCYRGKKPGSIIASPRDNQAAQLQPPQPISTDYSQQPVVVYHFPPNCPQEQPPHFPPQYMQESVQQHPPPYTQGPVQQYPLQYMQQPVQGQQLRFSPAYPQNLYSPTGPQYYNPPEAPPPYDTPSMPNY